MNKVTVNGLDFQAVETAEDTCAGCAAERSEPLCSSLPVCSSTFRDDGRNVVWVAEGPTKGDTQ